jgi:hypothetical protein
MNPKYPVYIPSRGRAESRYTMKALDKIRVPYFVVVEREEYDQYASVIESSRLLVLPESGRGLIFARCWIKQHSIANGDNRHWQFDDNIAWFARLNRNLKVPVGDGTIFRCMEDFSDRYENVAISGPNYFMFAKRKQKIPPIVLNTRVYSCSLINNAIPYEWDLFYNDDTDICLKALKGGWCIVQFNAFLCWKHPTMKVSGGNTPIYQGDGRLRMAKMLADRHPDVVKITQKWGRWQHSVDYRPFRGNQLKLRPDAVIPEGVNNYGMRLHCQVNYPLDNSLVPHYVANGGNPNAIDI